MYSRYLQPKYASRWRAESRSVGIAHLLIISAVEVPHFADKLGVDKAIGGNEVVR